jgi:hypothetical protein
LKSQCRIAGEAELVEVFELDFDLVSISAELIGHRT